MKFLIINGPNLNKLNLRDSKIYGDISLEKLEKIITEYCSSLSIKCSFFQSNIEGEIVDIIQKSENDFDGIILNAGGYTHTSVAIRDAVELIKTPVIEVHLSNIAAREEFRHKSLLTPVVDGVVMGMKHISYLVAVDALKHKLS